MRNLLRRSRSISPTASATKTDESVSREKNRKKASLAWIVLYGLIVFAGYSTFSSTTTQSYIHNEKVGQRDQCTVWMAPSSLKGVNGYGIFTTRNIPAGELILQSYDGVAIPIDRNKSSNYGIHSDARKQWKDVWSNYWWARGVPDHVAYEVPPSAVDYQIGFGALPNHHCVLDVLNTKYPPYNDAIVNRFHDPGTGAFSYNMGREFFVNEAVLAGDEIFLNYGYCERERPNMPDWAEFVFMTQEYEEAANIIQSYHFHQDKSRMTFDKLTGQLVPGDGVNTMTAQLLPKNKQELDEFYKDKSILADTTLLQQAIAKYSLNRHTPEWIQEHGMCLENLVPGISTIPNAGQGAFAQFPMKRGDIVAPAPLMQIVDKNSLNMYDNNDRFLGIQLVINYCFGHPESSLLLCPNTNAVLINHCSTRNKRFCRNGPNAEYRWSTGWDPTSDAWRAMSMEEIAEQPGRGLAFEVVATQDIEPGEEVFVDYGVEWEQAWIQHAKTWNPPTQNGFFITAKEANERTGPILSQFLSHDVRSTVNHAHLFTGCQYWSSDQDYHALYTEPDVDWEQLSDDEIMTRYSDDGRQFKTSRSYERHRDRSHWPCTVIWQDSSSSYVVRIHQQPWVEEDLPWHTNKLPRLLYDYPREGIHYFVRPFSSDQHLPGVFRHPMGIRDDMFPNQWKNLTKGS